MKKMAPNMEITEVSMMGQTAMKQVFDGTTGYAMQMGRKKNYDAAEIAEKKAANSLFEQLTYAINGTKLEVAAIEKVGSADAYKLTVTSAAGKSKAEFYYVKSGLLLKEEEVKKMGAQEITSSTEFKDYKKTGNVLFPQLLVQSQQTPMGALEIIIAIKETKVNEGVAAADFK